MQQCLKLLKKLNVQDNTIEEIQEGINQLGINQMKEVHKILEQRLYLDKKSKDEDKIVNMLLNIIEYSYLNKQ